MQRLEVSGAVRPIYGSLGVKGLTRILALDHGHLVNLVGKENQTVGEQSMGIGFFVELQFRINTTCQLII